MIADCQCGPWVASHLWADWCTTVLERCTAEYYSHLSALVRPAAPAKPCWLAIVRGCALLHVLPETWGWSTHPVWLPEAGPHSFCHASPAYANIRTNSHAQTGTMEDTMLLGCVTQGNVYPHVCACMCANIPPPVFFIKQLPSKQANL